MDVRIFKIAMMYFEALELSQDIKAILTGINSVRDGSIRNVSEFFTVLSEIGLDDKKIHKAIMDIMRSDDKQKILDTALYLGENSNKGITLLNSKTLSKLFDEEKLIDKIPQKDWVLFKDKEWVKQHKNSSVDKKKSVLVAINAVNAGRIKTKEEFLNVLKNEGVASNDIHNAIIDILKNNSQEDILKVISALSIDHGVGLLEKSWLSRNFDNTNLQDKLAPKFWHMFKDRKWLQENR